MMADPTPKVSVLVPCFRSAGYVARALDSVLAQTERDWELVAVDNASDDATFEVLLGYAARDPRIRAFRNDANVGPVRNWRRCAELARGRYAGLLFSDDWYQPDFLARALPLLDRDDGVGFVYSAVDVVAGEGAPAGTRGEAGLYRLDGPAVRPTAEFLSIAFGGRGRKVPVSPGCALMRREDLVRWLSTELPDAEALDYLRHGAGPDQAVYLEGCLAYPRFGHLAEPQVCFLAHGGNLSWRRDVAVGYARGLAHFYETNEAKLPLDRPRVAAKLAWRLHALGEEGASARLQAKLGLVGRALYAKEAFFAWRRGLKGKRVAPSA
jgi:glycosyltransferase involved in cell wall biosynthesis